ncbi:hypothetical protein [Nocardia asteroides]|uniref:hypothetical protein n=1 Tax=Nocardia asteroides TaxID=1824 RepID=UPI00364DBDFD
MAVLLGEKSRFAVEVGARASGLRRVDLWVADQWLTCDDNAVSVDQFRCSVEETVVSIRSGQVPALPFAALSPVATHRRFVAATGDDPICNLREQFWFLRWGPTTDNLLTFAFLDGNHLAITLQFWREAHLLDHPEHVGRVFEVANEPAELAGTLESLASAL